MNEYKKWVYERKVALLKAIKELAQFSASFNDTLYSHHLLREYLKAYSVNQAVDKVVIILKVQSYLEGERLSTDMKIYIQGLKDELTSPPSQPSASDPAAAPAPVPEAASQSPLSA